MTYKGKIQNGVVVLDDGADLAEGTVVRVEPVSPPPEEAVDGRARFKRLAGVIDDLPADMALNHDHYLHGHPKK